MVFCAWVWQEGAILAQGLPNLRPYQFAGWPDSLVVHTNGGAHVDSSVIFDTQQVVVDWALINQSGQDVTNRFEIHLSVDETQRVVRYSPGLNAFFPNWVTDENIGRLSRGFHTIRVEFDATQVVAENNESDNSIEKRIYVATTNAIPIRLFDSRRLPNDTFEFKIEASAGRRYEIQSSALFNTWQSLHTFTNLAGVFRFVDDSAGIQNRSYRVRMLTP